MTTMALPSLVLEVSRENAERLNSAINRHLHNELDPEIAEEVVYLVLRNFEDIAWTWHRFRDALGKGTPGPVARKALVLAMRMFDEWLQLASNGKSIAASVQALAETSDQLRKELAAAIRKIESAAEKINAVREDARAAQAMIDAPPSDLDAERLAEAEQLYAQGRFVDFKDAVARCRTGQK